MSGHVRGGRAFLLAVCLTVLGGGGALGQTESEPETQAEEPSLCMAPDDADAAARAGRMVPIGDAGAFDEALGCVFPVEEMTDPFTGRMASWHTFDDVGLPGLITRARSAEIDLSRRDVRRIPRERGVATAGRLRPGPFWIICIEHDPIPADTGINLFTNLNDKPFDDSPLPPGILDSPLAGVDGGYTAFPGSPPRAFVTFFPDGGQYYEADGQRFPFATMSTPSQTYFLIPSDGLGSTFTPFIFADNAMHYIDLLTNGALPVNGTVDLFPSCGPAQEVVHVALTIGGRKASNSTNWASAAFPLPPTVADSVTETIAGTVPYRAGVSFRSADPGASDPRPQETVATLGVADGNLNVLFPSGLMAYGYHRTADVQFTPTGDPMLDALLGSAARVFDEYMVPIQVTDAEGPAQLPVQRTDACLPPGEQVFDLVGP
jgi:hypothetical protein